MKKTLLMLAVALLCACSSDDETSQTSNLNLETTEVTIAFTSLEFEPMTRATLTGAFFVTTNVGINLSAVDWEDETVIDF